MKSNKIFPRIICLLLAVTVILSGCAGKSGDKDSKDKPSEKITDTAAACSEDKPSAVTEAASVKEEVSSSSSAPVTSVTAKPTEAPTSAKDNTTTTAGTQKTSASSFAEASKTKTTSTTTKTTKTTKTTITTKSTGTTKTTSTAKPTSVSPTKPASTSFFDDAVFVGDSVTLGLKNYVTSERNKGNSCLGKAQFLTAGSMGYTNTLPAIGSQESIHPKYKGTEVRIEDGVKKIGAKKVFIMLGLNDFCAYPQETGISNAEKCIKKIVSTNPGVSIYVQSVTPTVKNSGKFNNTNIDSFNTALKSMCQKNGWTYINVASVMKDANGCLKRDYCSDVDGRAVHMTYAGCKAWVDYLNKTFK